jgi:hypothetical protein
MEMAKLGIELDTQRITIEGYDQHGHPAQADRYMIYLLRHGHASAWVQNRAADLLEKKLRKRGRPPAKVGKRLKDAEEIAREVEDVVANGSVPTDSATYHAIAARRGLSFYTVKKKHLAGRRVLREAGVL